MDQSSVSNNENHDDDECIRDGVHGEVAVAEDDDQLPEISHDNSLAFPIKNEVLKGVIVQFYTDELLIERLSISAFVRETPIYRAKDFNIVIDDIAIMHSSYGAEFSKAVEWKHVAERSKFLVAKAEQEMCATIIRAEGESESAKLISDATSAFGMGLIELRRIEASREIVSTLGKTPTVTYLPNGNYMLLGLNSSMVGR
ncbi:Prohibitin-3, mitochondrial [Sarracenia purpurea var. burkii]